MNRLLTGLSALGLVLAVSADGRAQAEHYANRPLEANVHVGALAFDEGDTEALIGGRLVYNLPSGFGIGGNLDWSPVDDDVNVYLYSVDLNYTFPSDAQAHFFVSGGIGAATISLDLPDEFADDDSETDLLVPIGGGIKWFNRTNDSTWGLRAEVRDNIIFAEGFEFADGAVEEDTEATHNFEFSGGVSFFFGGGR